MAVDSAVALDEFSMSLRTMNAHPPHNNAIAIELMSLLVDVFESCAFVFVAVVLSMQIHFRECPVKEWKYVSEISRIANGEKWWTGKPLFIWFCIFVEWTELFNKKRDSGRNFIYSFYSWTFWIFFALLSFQTD